MFMIMSGVFWTVEFEEKLDPKRKYIFCPNHSSTLDIPLVTDTVTTSIYGKKISFYSIIWIFYRKNSIIVDRSKIRDSYVNI